MDFNGKGYVEEEDFFNTLFVHKLPFSRDEIHQFFVKEKLFTMQNGRLAFEPFKKAFFPLYAIDGNDEEEEAAANGEELNIIEEKDKERQSEAIVARLIKIEKELREKFANNWTSVRKAFLDIDEDYDGFITAEDLARVFGRENKKLDFRDLRTLIKNRDSRRKGKIDFKDFCKWMGGAIEPCEGFYFRHDSVKNPQYEQNLEKQRVRSDKGKQLVAEGMSKDNLTQRILEKMQLQWKTLKKAFSDLNKGKLL